MPKLATGWPKTMHLSLRELIALSIHLGRATFRSVYSGKYAAVDQNDDQQGSVLSTRETRTQILQEHLLNERGLVPWE